MTSHASLLGEMPKFFSLLIKSLTAAVQPSEKESESPEIYKVITEEKFPTNRESNSEGMCTNKD